MTSRGIASPPFEQFVFGPVVDVDLDGDEPPGELLEKTTTRSLEARWCGARPDHPQDEPIGYLRRPRRQRVRGAFSRRMPCGP